MSKRAWIRWSLLIGLFATAMQAQALILTAPPRESAADAAKLYQPLADYLSKLLGVEVKYEFPGNWLSYQNNMRDDKYDIVFDGPHFISWRIANAGHEALVRLPGDLQFVLVTDKDNDKINKPDDLIGKPICGISPPNLSTLSVLDYYRNPVRQPMIKGIKGGMGKVLKSFMQDKICDAAVLRTTYFKKKLTDEDRAKLKVVVTSKAMPNQGISVSKRLSAELKEKIKKSLTVGDGVAVTQAIVKRFGGKQAKSFIPTSSTEFNGFNNLLEGVIFGW